MYVPAHFEETRFAELHRIIGQNPLGALVIKGPNGLDANHVPFELDGASAERGVLRAHVARANPVWTEVREGDDVLVIFRAADAYISPNRYPSKHEFPKDAPQHRVRADCHTRGKCPAVTWSRDDPNPSMHRSRYSGLRGDSVHCVAAFEPTPVRPQQRWHAACFRHH